MISIFHNSKDYFHPYHGNSLRDIYPPNVAANRPPEREDDPHSTNLTDQEKELLNGLDKPAWYSADDIKVKMTIIPDDAIAVYFRRPKASIDAKVWSRRTTFVCDNLGNWKR